MGNEIQTKPGKRCPRCGGTGTYTKGRIVNGVCFGCWGTGIKRQSLCGPSRRSRRCVQYAITDDRGFHLALNTDRAALEGILPTLTGVGALKIEEVKP